jgi:hypothetical protein
MEIPFIPFDIVMDIEQLIAQDLVKWKKFTPCVDAQTDDGAIVQFALPKI